MYFRVLIYRGIVNLIYFNKFKIIFPKIKLLESRIFSNNENEPSSKVCLTVHIESKQLIVWFCAVLN